MAARVLVAHVGQPMTRMLALGSRGEGREARTAESVAEAGEAEG